MLPRYKSPRESDASLDSIHNYYEQMVLDTAFRQVPEEERRNIDFIADVACVALNHLPPRYVRHDVDMAFYLSPREQEEMEEKVLAAVNEAVEFVRARQAEQSPAGDDAAA